jgi:Ca2+-binding RTX toxin-like protein
MLWLAGILGLLGVGGAALLDFSDDSSAGDEDDTQPNDDTDTPVVPADEFLDGTGDGSGDSGVEQHLDICDFIDPGVGQGIDEVSTGDTDTSDVGGQPGLTGAHLTGSEESNIISGSEDGDQIDGRGGDDQLNGYDGDDVLAGDAGDDTLHGALGDDTLEGGTGDDLLHGE